MSSAITAQTGGLQFAGGPDLTEYSLFIGGLSATNNALKHYTPLVTGYNRLFIVRPPTFVIDYFKNTESGDNGWYSPKSLWIQAKHILEYAFLSVTGFQESTIETDTLSGGYANRSIAVPTGRTGHTTQIQVTVPEFSGSPIRQVFRDIWMNGIIDEMSGATTYQGKVAVDKYNNPAYIEEGEIVGQPGTPGIGYQVNEANHSAEAIWVQTDRSLMNVENAIMCAYMYPINVTSSNGGLDYTTGQHDLMQTQITFNVVTYRSNPVTAIADKLLKTYYISCNTLNMNPELGSIFDDAGSIDTNKLGVVPHERSNNTLLGNRPVYTYDANYVPKVTREIELNRGKRYDTQNAGVENRDIDYVDTYSPLAQGRLDK